MRLLGIGLVLGALVLAGCPSFPEDGRYACTETAPDCPDGRICLDGECVVPQQVDPCADVTCTGGEVCDPTTGTCVTNGGACDPPCNANETCEPFTGVCVPDEFECIPACVEPEVCDTSIGQCVGCLTHDDCPDPETICDPALNECLVPCEPACSDDELCDVATENCVECLAPTDCKADGVGVSCTDGLCVCTGDDGCPTGAFCNVASGGECHFCATDDNCDGEEICQNGECMPACDEVCDPESEVCNPDTGECQACLIDTDCSEPTLMCQGGECVEKCAGVTCPGETPVCRPDTGNCVECLDDNDCLSLGLVCSDSNQCGPACDAICDVGQDCHYDDRVEADRCFTACEGEDDPCLLHERCMDLPSGAFVCLDILCAPLPDASWSSEIVSVEAYGAGCTYSRDGVDHSGICVGPIEIVESFAPLGRCVAPGNVDIGSNDECDPKATHSNGDQACVDGGLCVVQGGIDQCLPLCRGVDEACVGDQGYCQPLYGITGACVASDGEGGGGASCNGDSVCQSGYICHDNACHASCETHADAADQCPDELNCSSADRPDNPLLGYCREATVSP